MSYRTCFLSFVLCLPVLVSGCYMNDDELLRDDLRGGGQSSDPTVWKKSVFNPRSDFSQRCVNPRDDDKYQDLQGTAMYEKMWLRSMSNDLYLWNDELEDIDPEPFGIAEYFDELKVPFPQDRFHWSQSTEKYQQGSHSGVYFGYGISWVLLDQDTHEFGVGEIEQSANVSSSIKRGDAILGADGVYITDIYEEGISEDEAERLADVINNAIYPLALDESHLLILRDRDTGGEKSVSVTAADVYYSSVPISKTIDTDTGRVAYLQFNRHNAIAEGELYDAISELEDDNVTDLVLDLRYNGGGYIFIASELSYMIAGRDHTDGQTFVFDNFNNDIGLNDPFSGEPRDPTPFYTVTTESESLPTLNLDRVYVLTSGNTCSASELIMNGLAGVDVEVVQVGTTTCGKPYGFYPMENCGTTYFTIMSSNDNAKGFGDFYNGFSPSSTDFSAPDVFPGCEVSDDFRHDLGDKDEAMLSAALQFRATGDCPKVKVANKALGPLKQKTVQPQRRHLFTPKGRNQNPISIMTVPSRESF